MNRKPSAVDDVIRWSMHKHRCMRCNEEFNCQTPSICTAQYDVLPTIVTLDAWGRPKLTEHCPHLAPRAAPVPTPDGAA